MELKQKKTNPFDQRNHFSTSMHNKNKERCLQFTIFPSLMTQYLLPLPFLILPLSIRQRYFFQLVPLLIPNCTVLC